MLHNHTMSPRYNTRLQSKTCSIQQPTTTPRKMVLRSETKKQVGSELLKQLCVATEMCERLISMGIVPDTEFNLNVLKDKKDEIANFDSLIRNKSLIYLINKKKQFFDCLQIVPRNPNYAAACYDIIQHNLVLFREV